MNKVLIIDDNPADRQLLNEILRNSGVNYDIIQVSSTETANQEIKQNLPDLILLDIQMPNKNGLDVLKELSQDTPYTIPVILVSSFASDTDRMIGSQFGATDFIQKPINPAELKARVATQIRLKKLFDDMQWASKKTNKSIRSLYNEVEKKNKRLKELDQIKSELVNTVSHELRTPLAISKEAISLILDGIAGNVNDKQRKYLKSSHDNLIRLNTIIDDFLDMSKIEAGKIKLKRSFVDFKKVLQQLGQDYEKIMSTKKQTLKVNLPDEELFLFIDSDKLIQVVNNLLNNAYKFTSDEGVIELNLESREKEVLCSIKDNGVGISSEDMTKLFGKFEQFDRKAGAGIKGTGLGLAISKSLIELHDGKIWAESEKGKGTTFIFSLPNHDRVRENFDDKLDRIIKETRLGNKNVSLIVIHLSNANKLKEKYGDCVLASIMNGALSSLEKVFSRPDDELILYDIHSIYIILPDTNRYGGQSVLLRVKNVIRKCQFESTDDLVLDFKFGLSIFPENGSDRNSIVNKAFEEMVRKKNVLIVDDHLQIIRILKARLKDSGFDLTSARDGEDAIDLISQNKPDLIVLDIIMPKMNGYEVLGRLKENVDTAAIPVIILTAKIIETVKKEYQALGDIPVIQKTGGFGELVKLIQYMV